MAFPAPILEPFTGSQAHRVPPAHFNASSSQAQLNVLCVIRGVTAARGSGRFDKARHRGLGDSRKISTVEMMALCLRLQFKDKGKAWEVVLPSYLLYQVVPLVGILLQLCKILRKARVIHASLFQRRPRNLGLVLHAWSADETVEGVHKTAAIECHHRRPLCHNPPSAQMRSRDSP